MSGVGLGSSKKGSRSADSSMVTQFRRVYAQGTSDSTYSGDRKKNVFRSSIAVVNTASFASANTTYGNITGSIKLTIPDAPILVSLNNGDSQLIAVFTEGFNGGTPILDYEYSLDGGATFISASTTSSPIVIAGLTNGTSYTVEVRAINSVGASASSNSLTQTANIVVETFTTTGTTAWTAPEGITSVNYLVVGGGGGGGNGYDNGGGGGGGGGMVRTGTLSVIPGTSYTVTVGGGGAGGENIRSDRPGTDGNPSLFDTISSLGGGRGKGSRTTPYTSAGAKQILDPLTAPTGGSGSGGGAGGDGGGGANSDGTPNSGTTGGAGGSGISSSISGVSVTYGEGGDGANSGVSNGGGNDGGVNTGTGGDGGGAGSGSSVGGGAGRAGIVILSY